MTIIFIYQVHFLFQITARGGREFLKVYNKFNAKLFMENIQLGAVGSYGRGVSDELSARNAISVV